MKNSKDSAKAFVKGLKNFFGVGIFLLVIGLLLESLTIVLRQWISFPVSLPVGLQIMLTLLCVIFCLSGIIWFNKTLNLVKIYFAGGENKLMTYGPFNYVRHPLYATFLISLPPLMIIWYEDFLFIIPWVFMFIISYYMILLEEQGLIRIFGEAYKIYKEFVPMLLPYKGAGGMRFRKYYVKVEMTNRTKNQGEVNGLKGTHANGKESETLGL